VPHMKQLSAIATLALALNTSCSAAERTPAQAAPAQAVDVEPTPPAPPPPQPAQPAAPLADPCRDWLRSRPELLAYLEQPLAADVASKEGASADALAAAFHQLMLAFVKRDSLLLQELLPATGELTVVNTMEAETGTRELGALRKQLSARKGPLYANLLAGEDDDYADRFGIRATLPWCRTGPSFYLLGEHPSDISFVRFTNTMSPKLIALGTAGL
jgi:hypothetical protein